MVSINNTAQNSAVLLSLRQINKDLATTQTRIGTGLKVNSASDNILAWSASQSLKTEQNAQDTFKASVSLLKGRADTTSAALDQINDLLSQMKDVLVSAKSTGADMTALDAQIVSLQSQIKGAIKGATFKGENWLSGVAAARTVVIDSNGTALSFTNTQVFGRNSGDTADAGYLFSATSASSAIDFDLTTDGTTTSVLDNTKIDAMITTVNTAMTSTTTALTAAQGFSKTLDRQIDFQQKLTDIRSSAISSLVDADMEQESAKLTALQVKQQLAYQALSIGNSAAQNILMLFR